MDKESRIRKRNTKENTREKIRRGGHKQKKITKMAKVRVYWNVAEKKEFWDYVSKFEQI
jgi:hypothetical protein